MSIELDTCYGGLSLPSPVIVGACPLTAQEQTRIAIESAGAGAIVLPSVFEEQIMRWNHRNGLSLTENEKHLMTQSERVSSEWMIENADSYLDLVQRASSQHNIPIIASINGYTTSGWMDYATQLQQAGAAAIELNIHHAPIKAYLGARMIEEAVINEVRAISSVISIPLHVKLEHHFTSVPHLARQLLSGVQGIVLFGRAPHTNVCLDTLTLKTDWGLTHSGAIVHSLETILQVHEFCPAMSIAASGGIGHSDDVIKTLLAGADVAMVTSAIYREGIDVIRSLIDGLIVFMEQKQLRSLRDLEAHRPLEFDSEESRTAYMAAISTNPDASNSGLLDPEICGDRWGHPNA